MRALYLLLLFFPAFLTAQLTDSSYSYIAYWSVGDTISYTHRTSEKKYKFGELQDSTLYSGNFEFRVKEESEEHYLIDWYEFGGTYSDPMMQLFMEQMKGIENFPISYRTTELGNFERLLNFEQIKQMAEDAIDSVIVANKLGEGSLTQNIRRNGLVDFTSEQAFNASESMTAVNLFHTFQGREYPLYDTIWYDEEIVARGGGDNVPGQAYFFINKVDTVNQHVYIINRIILDPEATRGQALHYNLATRAAGLAPGVQFKDKSESEIRAIFADIDFYISIVKSYIIHAPTGYPVSIYFQKTTNVGDLESENEFWDNTTTNEVEIDFDSIKQ